MRARGASLSRGVATGLFAVPQPLRPAVLARMVRGNPGRGASHATLDSCIHPYTTPFYFCDASLHGSLYCALVADE